MFNWLNLGKSNRSKFGKWLDHQEITQLELEKVTKLSRGTISKLCNDNTYRPKFSTMQQVTRGLKKLGKSVEVEEFWI
ncbi:hypothetical protein BACCIP111899_01600 [Bacillus rhizoplanae]|uniref:HTH cro/C1-type domain-containing protein n=1 Tax=Bacillus rhizoplanae TaxID=2880966 RepID=A0ABM8Y9M1_9BACI|nr:helix-turn-helix domain-containing protein [Bacillus rhizoplanae]CAG9612424.1 hypothetical protein BACCIP111899_01600 [Bacillus rhizoplanae]